MKFIKNFESNKGYYVVVELEEGIIENITIWDDVESAKNYITNIIHVNEEFYEEEDYECRNIFDVDELLEYWNNKYPDKYIKFEYCFVEEKLELKPHLKMRKDAKKYNL